MGVYERYTGVYPMASMNKSEKAAFKWLQNQKGYDESEIIRASHKQTPDFKLQDGTGFEVKKDYNGTVVFHETQMKDIEDSTRILIVSEDTIHQIRYEDLDDSGFDVRVQESPDSKVKRIKPDLAEEINEYPGASFSEKMLKWRYDDQDNLSADDVEDAVSRALERDLPELLRREVR